MKKGKTENDAVALVKKGQQAGLLSSSSSQIVIRNLDATNLPTMFGGDLDLIDSDSVTNVALILDASGSMAEVQQVVIDGFNTIFVEGVKEAKGAEEVHLSLHIFSDRAGVIYHDMSIDQTPKLTSANYVPAGMTALNDAIMNAIIGIVGPSIEQYLAGLVTKNMLVVMSDGKDNASSTPAREVKALLQQLLQTKMWTVFFIGVHTGHVWGDEDFNEVAKGLGFPAAVDIKALGKHGVREGLGLATKSVIRQAQSAVVLPPNTFLQ